MEIYKSVCKSYIEKGLKLEDLNNYENFKDYFSAEEFRKIINEKKNRANKRSRTKNHIMQMFRYKLNVNNKLKVIFITINPNDEMLRTKEDTYMRKIDKWIKKHCIYAILNKDYGSKTEREHYHAIALSAEPLEQLLHENGKPKLSKKGLPLYEFVNKDFNEICKSKERQFEPTLCEVNLIENDLSKTVNYLLKLNNHSNKITTRNRIRVLKNNAYKMLETLMKKNVKNTSYDVLNKRSTSTIRNNITKSITE